MEEPDLEMSDRSGDEILVEESDDILDNKLS